MDSNNSPDTLRPKKSGEKAELWLKLTAGALGVLTALFGLLGVIFAKKSDDASTRAEMATQQSSAIASENSKIMAENADKDAQIASLEAKPGAGAKADASPATAHPLAFKVRTFKIVDEDCYGSNGLDFDGARVTSDGTPGFYMEFEYSSCPAAGHVPSINIQNGAESMATVSDDEPTYDECDAALSSQPIESFLPRAGDTFCVKTSSGNTYQTAAGPIIGYAHVDKISNGADGTPYRGSITLKASGWLVNQ